MKVAEILFEVGLDQEQLLRAILYFIGQLDRENPKPSVVNEKGIVLCLKSYDFLANSVSYKYSAETTRWFRTQEDANSWLADEGRYAYAACDGKRDSYQFPATAQVEYSGNMDFDAWQRLVEPTDL